MELLDPSSLGLVGEGETAQGEVVFLLDEATRLIGALGQGDIAVACDISRLLPAVVEDTLISVVLRA